jgi:hypothetical protein
MEEPAPPIIVRQYSDSSAALTTPLNQRMGIIYHPRVDDREEDYVIYSLFAHGNIRIEDDAIVEIPYDEMITYSVYSEIGLFLPVDIHHTLQDYSLALIDNDQSFINTNYIRVNHSFMIDHILGPDTDGHFQSGIYCRDTGITYEINEITTLSEIVEFIEEKHNEAGLEHRPIKIRCFFCSKVEPTIEETMCVMNWRTFNQLRMELPDVGTALLKTEIQSIGNFILHPEGAYHPNELTNRCIYQLGMETLLLMSSEEHRLIVFMSAYGFNPSEIQMYRVLYYIFREIYPYLLDFKLFDPMLQHLFDFTHQQRIRLETISPMVFQGKRKSRKKNKKSGK